MQNFDGSNCGSEARNEIEIWINRMGLKKCCCYCFLVMWLQNLADCTTSSFHIALSLDRTVSLVIMRTYTPDIHLEADAHHFDRRQVVGNLDAHYSRRISDQVANTCFFLFLICLVHYVSCAMSVRWIEWSDANNKRFPIQLQLWILLRFMIAQSHICYRCHFHRQCESIFH